MHYYEVAPTQIIRAESDTFTYQAAQPLAIGSLVAISVGKKQLVGVVIREVPSPAYETKAVTRLIETRPLPAQLVATTLWIAAYYTTHLATVLQTVLPRGLEKTRRQQASIPRTVVRKRTSIVLSEEQASAIKAIAESSPGSILLHGVTGSGKTMVYIEAAKQALMSGKSVIILVPEIALTSQLVDEFSHHFKNILLTHSKQTEAQRHAIWKEALLSNEPVVAIGPRSALFMPLADIGLVVIDEAHEPSYKQEQSPRYHALRVASILAQHHQAKVILGSATPSVTDYYLATASKRPVIRLTRQARDAVTPTVSLVDMTKRANFSRHRFLSDKLLTTLAQTSEEGHQTLIFHNRRGSASTTLCEHCGWQAGCPRCYVPLTLHADHHELRCHICGFSDRVPTSCPTCGHAEIIHKGIGTKLIESELIRLFPNKNIARFDADNATDQSVDKRYKELYDGTIDIIIGTQVVAKGLDLPRLRTVGVVQADAGLSLPDFTASERTFQLLAQVVGRVGRNQHETQIVMQSYQPSHPAVVDGIAQNYMQFYDRTLKERRRAHFPPFSFLLKLTCTYKTESAAIKNAKKLAATLRQHVDPSVEILGPTPAFYERQHDTYRWQLVLKSAHRQHLVNTLAWVPSTYWQTELDPLSLL